MRRVEIIAKGDVQQVSFRDRVQKIGRDLELSGTVENREPYDVAIVAEGEEEALHEFLRALKIRDTRPDPGPGAVEVRWSKATGEFPSFKILRGEWHEEVGESLDFAIKLLQRSIEANEVHLTEARRILDGCRAERIAFNMAGQ